MSFNPKKVQDIELDRIRNNPEMMSLYVQGKEMIKKSGMINFLRIFSRPFTLDRGANPYSGAYMAAHTEGYNKCLDDLIYFEEMYLGPEIQKKDIKATFGGLGLAVAKGDLTPSEAEGFKNGKY